MESSSTPPQLADDTATTSSISTGSAPLQTTSTTRPNKSPSGPSPDSEQAHAHLHGRAAVPESIKDFRLFDGQNSPQNIAVYGFGLGALFGASMVLATLVRTSIPQFWLFLAALGVFHALEYIAIALFNPTKLKLDCRLM